MKLKEAIKKAVWCEISAPVGTIGRMLRKEEFAFKVAKSEVKFELRHFLHFDMDKLEDSNEIRVVAVPHGLTEEDFYLRITFG